MMELLLVSPLTVPQIVRGQWRAGIRLFGLPLGLCLAAQLAGTFVAQNLEWKGVQAANAAMAATATNSPVALTPPTATGTTAVSNVTVVFGAGVTVPRGSTTNTTIASSAATFVPSPVFTLTMSTCSTTVFLANLVALVWFGMWMGLTVKTTHQAALRTLVFVQVIPWFVVTVVSAMLVTILLMPMLYKKAAFVTSAAPMLGWFPLLMAGTGLALCLTKDIGFALWARHKIHTEFRERSIGQVEALQLAPPLLPPKLAAQVQRLEK
jgi:hypothetical protein